MLQQRQQGLAGGELQGKRPRHVDIERAAGDLPQPAVIQVRHESQGSYQHQARFKEPIVVQFHEYSGSGLVGDLEAEPAKSGDALLHPPGKVDLLLGGRTNVRLICTEIGFAPPVAVAPGPTQCDYPVRSPVRHKAPWGAGQQRLRIQGAVFHLSVLCAKRLIMECEHGRTLSQVFPKIVIKRSKIRCGSLSLAPGNAIG
jgi:hypothetical protein